MTSPAPSSHVPADENPTSGASGFHTTRWTQVLQARGDSVGAQLALSELCQAYYTPVFTFIRRRGANEDTARDLTQGFFVRLLARHGLANLEPGRGRFRSFLLGAVKHFLADQYDHDRAAKRGGGQSPLPLEAGSDTTGTLQVPDPAGPAPDTYFDRDWAQALVGRALDALAGEQRAIGKESQYEKLKPWLVGNLESLSQAEAARELEMTEGAIKVAIHRLRQRFRELVRLEIAQTVEDPSHIQAELHYLLEVLSASG